MTWIDRVTSSSAAAIAAALFTGAMTVFAGMFIRGRSNSHKLDLIEQEQKHAARMRDEDRQRITTLEKHLDDGFKTMREEQQAGFREIRSEIRDIASQLGHKRDK